MRIAITMPHASYYYGGTEVVSLYQAEHLARLGHDIYFFTRKTDAPTDNFIAFKDLSQRLPINIIEVQLDNSVPYADGSWPTFYDISEQFGKSAKSSYAQIDTDIFISHLSADAIHIPTNRTRILHLHGTPSETDEIMDAGINNSDYLIAHSSSILEWWHSKYPDKKIEIFRNGVEFERFFAPVDRPRSIDVLCAGRLLSHKGFLDVIEAVKPTVRLTIAGSGPDLDLLRNRASERSLGNVAFVVKPDTEELIRLYKSAKVFACPSRGREGVLTTMLEAGAAGCAILTASGSGMTDLANPNTALIVEPGNSEAIARSIDSMLSNSSFRGKIAQNIQNEIKTNWSWEKKALQLEEFYRHALS